jgi:hypothetical protein
MRTKVCTGPMPKPRRPPSAARVCQDGATKGLGHVGAVDEAQVSTPAMKGSISSVAWCPQLQQGVDADGCRRKNQQHQHQLRDAAHDGGVEGGQPPAAGARELGRRTPASPARWIPAAPASDTATVSREPLQNGPVVITHRKTCIVGGAWLRAHPAPTGGLYLPYTSKLKYLSLIFL